MRNNGIFTKTLSNKPGRICGIYLLLCFLFLSSTFTYARNDQQTITLNVQNASLEKVFAEIERQTHYSFLYMQAVLKNARHVNVKVSNAPIEKVLELCFKDQPQLTYSIMDKVVVVKAKPTINQGPVKKEVENPIDVTGQVTDEIGKPLSGANVKVLGTNTGVVTDAEGRFTLNNINENAVLEISYVGHQPVVIPVKGQRTLAINLKQNSILDEAVVIGYGTTTKRLATGNVTSVKARDIEKQPINNPLLALQGRVPGLQVTQSSGLPGSGVTVRIQGINSITSGKDPLYIIDGVPYASQLLPTWGTVLGNSGGVVQNNTAPGNGNPLSFINPMDIESIEVLKDADATAIYGSRASNGAILITTKKGKEGKPKVDLNIQQGWGKVSNKMELLNTSEYVMMRKEALKNDGLTPSANPLASFPESYAPDLTIWDTTRQTDWQKELIGKTMHYTDVQASVSGGSANTQFLIGTGYHRESTVFPGDFSDQKASVHFNINSISPNRKFKIQFSGNYLSDWNNIMSTDLTTIALNLPPNAPTIYNEDGTINWAPNALGTSTWISYINPIAFTYRKYKIKSSNLLGNLVVGYQILPGLEIKSSLGYSNIESNETLTFPMIAILPQDKPSSQRSASYSLNTIRLYIIEPQITYKKSIKRSSFDVLLGSTYQQTDNDGKRLAASGFSSDRLLEDIKGATNVSVPFSTIISTYKYGAVFGRINYNFDERYIINLTGRRDGSSRFGDKNRYHTFGGVGLAWLFSNEGFVRDNIKFLSFGKIRGSYGTTGNDQIGEYRYLSTYTPIFGIQVPYQQTASLQPSGLPNPYLEWEETKKLQLGIELGLFRDRILITTNYINNRSSNQLVSYGLPVMTGFGTVAKNFPATIRNTNWEFALSTVNVRSRSFNWTSSINLTLPKNKLVSFPNFESSTYSSLLIVGQPVTITKLFRSLGVNNATGIFEYEDAQGNSTSDPNFLADRITMVNTAQTAYGGIENTIRYNNFELSFLFQFVKQKGQPYTFGNQPGTLQLNQPTSVLDRWIKPGDIATNQRYNSDNSLLIAYLNIFNSDAAFSDASYVRLKNATFSWQIPNAWKRAAHLENCRLYIQGQNLATITGFYGLDPETGNGALPPLRMVTLGVQLTL